MTKTAITFPIDEPVDAPATVTFWQAFRLWIKLGLIDFGGPAGQISLLHRDMVEQPRWSSEPRFLHALNFFILLPGPAGPTMDTFIGCLPHPPHRAHTARVLYFFPMPFFLI